MHVKIKIRLLNSSGQELHTKNTDISVEMPMKMADLREQIKIIGVAQMRLHIQALNRELTGWDDYVRSEQDIGAIKYWVVTWNTCVPLDTLVSADQLFQKTEEVSIRYICFLAKIGLQPPLS